MSCTPICDIGEPIGPMLNGSTYIVRPRIAAVEQFLQRPAHLERVFPVVGRTGGVLRKRTDEGAILDASDVAGVGARVVTARPEFLVQLDERAAATIWRAERVVLLRRAVDPVDGGGLGQLGHLLDPAQQVGVPRERGRRIAGLTNRLNVIGAVPYVLDQASQGVLHGIDGFQDLTLAAKFTAFERPSVNVRTVRAIGVVSVSLPLTNYNPELPPLSIGSGSTRLSLRGTLNYQSGHGLYLDGSPGYTWRQPVTLDRPYFYTDDEFVMSDEVPMPSVFDYVVSAGYARNGLMALATFSQQRTTGGGDIRRQDMPFVSNRMNFSKVGGMGMYPIPKLPLSVQLSYAYTVKGRNVGQATTFTAGLLYLFGSSRAMRMPRTLSLGLVVAVTAASPLSAGQAGTSTDAGAGNWRMIALTGPTQIVVPAPAQTEQRRLPGGAGRDQERAVAPHLDAAEERRVLGRRRRHPVERDPHGPRGALQPAARAEPRRHLSGSRREQSVRGPQLPVRQSSLRGARVQLCLGRAIRGLEDRVVLQVPLQPSVPGKTGQQHQGVDARFRPACLSVGGCGHVRRQRRDDEAPLPGLGGGDHAEGRRTAPGRPALGPGLGQ